MVFRVVLVWNRTDPEALLTIYPPPLRGRERGPVRLIAEKKLNVGFWLVPPHGHLGFLNLGYPSRKRELLVFQPLRGDQSDVSK